MQKVSNVTFKTDLRTYFVGILNILKFKVLKCFYFQFVTGNVESRGFLFENMSKKFIEVHLQWISNCNKEIALHKVHTFWEDHKIMRNLHLEFDWHYTGQK